MAVNTVNKYPKNKVEVFPVYCFDPRFYNLKTKYQTMKCGFIRAKFNIESVQDLRSNIESIQNRLYVAHEQPELFIPKLLDLDNPNKPKNIQYSLVFQQEVCYEETEVEKLLKSSLGSHGFEFYTFWGRTIYHYDDLVRPYQEIVNNFTSYYKKAEGTKVRDLVAAPAKGELPACSYSTEVQTSASQYMPSFQDLGINPQDELPTHKHQCLNFLGGETAGVARVQSYINDYKGMKDYNTLRNGFIGPNFSSKFSPWMANGSVSPRYILSEVKKWIKSNSNNEHTKSFISELFWRDFFCYWAKYQGNKIFYEYGPKVSNIKPWVHDQDLVQRWRDGLTGIPIVDAIMRDLKATGYISNRGRQMVACLLSVDLQQDWRWGAYWFEERLIDHDVHSNTGGWNAASGLRPGAVLKFNMLKQSRDHDKNGDYIRMWCPELKLVPGTHIHDPWLLKADQQKKYNCVIGKDYPTPVPLQKYNTEEFPKALNLKPQDSKIDQYFNKQTKQNGKQNKPELISNNKEAQKLNVYNELEEYFAQDNEVDKRTVQNNKSNIKNYRK